MQFRIYDRQTLKYKDGGYVASYIIDDDYIVNNNSTIKVIRELKEDVIVGDTIALIDTSGAYHKGTISTIDNSSLTINYKGEKELFNDNMLNPLMSHFLDEKISVKFELKDIATILTAYFVNPTDKYRKLPLKIIIEGEKNTMLWNWANEQINIVDWLTNIFERYNVSLRWTIDFNIAEELQKRKPYYIVTISAITNSGKIIKDNVANQTITYTQKELPNATVCAIIDSTTKEIITESSGKNIFNPYNHQEGKNESYNNETKNLIIQNDSTSNISNFIAITPNTQYTLSCKYYDGVTRHIVWYNKDKETPIRADSYYIGITGNRCAWTVTSPTDKDTKFVRITYCAKSTELQLEEGGVATDYDAYNQSAIYYLINKAGVDTITKDSNSEYRVLPVKMVIKSYDTNNDNDTTPYDVAEDTLIPSKFNQAIEIRINRDSRTFDFENVMCGDLFKIVNAKGTINSVFTGRKEENTSKWVTLYFGLGRQNYTDLIQVRMRKSKYQELYNQSK